MISFFNASMCRFNYIPINFFWYTAAGAIWQKAKWIWICFFIRRLTATFHAAMWAFISEISAIKYGGWLFHGVAFSKNVKSLV